MTKSSVKILGMMSGTSGDGIDGALMRFDSSGTTELLWYDSFDFSNQQFDRLKKLINFATAREITLGASYMSELYAMAIDSFLDRQKERPDFIAAHGQTIFHHPEPVNWDGINLNGTLQLLDGSRLAIRCGFPVICNFRCADMAVGGQGAPLVPFADLSFLGTRAKRDLIALNIGGIANISVITRKTKHFFKSQIQKSETDTPKILTAFDTGPGNTLMDSLMQLEKTSRFDKNGELAATGRTNKELLNQMISDSYFEAQSPKSTGREYFNLDWLLKFDSVKQQRIPIQDLMSTLLDLTIESITHSIRGLSNQIDFPADLVVSGGGALNQLLMQRLYNSLKDICEISISDDWGMPITAKEAMAFAILGHAFLIRKSSNVPSATGAKEEVILGQLHPVTILQNPIQPLYSLFPNYQTD